MNVEIRCAICKHPMVSIVLTSYPPQYKYKCMNCNRVIDDSFAPVFQAPVVIYK